MIIKPKECDGCEYKNIGQSFAKPEGPSPYTIGICGEAPGQEEAAEGRPFVGASGWHMRSFIARAGLAEAECACVSAQGVVLGAEHEKHCRLCLGLSRLSNQRVAIFNTINCRPPGNDYTRVGREVVAACRERHWPQPAKEAVTLLVGRNAVAAFYPDLDYPGALERWRGSLLPHPQGMGWCIPTYHPAFALRGKRYILPIIASDTAALVGANVAARELVPKIVNTLTLEKGATIAIDIETDRKTEAITLIGISGDGRSVLQLGLEDFKAWYHANQAGIQILLAHNARFDVTRLEKAGVGIVRETVVDTMLAFKIYQSDSQKVGLDTACSITLPDQQLYWKSLVGSDKDRVRDKSFVRQVWQQVYAELAYYSEDAWFRFYNALDTMMTWRLGVRLKRVLEAG